MLGALLGVLASVVSLKVSDGKLTQDWSMQPTVYLAIASAATKIFVHYALIQAVDVAWWTRALKKATTVTDLHYAWDHEHSLLAALTALFSRRHFSAAARCRFWWLWSPSMARWSSGPRV